MRRLWRAHRVKAGAALGAAALSLFALGCPQPADLQDPQSFPAPPGAGTGGSSTGGSGTGGSGMTMNCETACMAAIINASGTGCKTCHGKAVMLAGTLDFESPGYTARLKDKPAEHAGIVAGMTCPSGDKLIDTANPANSWLLKKVTNQQGTCGTVMPSTGALPPADQMCVTTYVNCVAGGMAAGGGGMPSGGSSTGGAATGGGGSGGAATGGGGAATGGGGAATGGGGSGGTGGV